MLRTFTYTYGIVLGTKRHITSSQTPTDYIRWIAQQAGHWKLSRDVLKGYRLHHIDTSQILYRLCKSYALAACSLMILAL